MLKRLEKIRISIKKLGIDALFVSNQFNVSYLTGFTGLSQNEREGFLFITPKNAYLLTFPTYFGLFEKGGDDFKTVNITHEKRLSDQINGIIKNENIQSAGFEEDNLTVAEFSSLKKKVRTKWQKTKGVVENLRVIKDEAELSNIRHAAKITDQAFAFIKGRIKKGVTEKELALELEFFLKEHSDGVAFSPIVAFNEHSAIPHYLPTDDQPASPARLAETLTGRAGGRLTTNSLILLDFGTRVNGYCADMTRVVFYGKPEGRQAKIYRTVLAAQTLALKKIKCGLTGDIVDKIARDYITSQGYPEYPHGLGHGVGLDIHEDPRLKKESKIKLRENMVVTVEPGIYLPGNCGVRIEDLVVLKKDGVEILTQSPKEMIII